MFFVQRNELMTFEKEQRVPIISFHNFLSTLHWNKYPSEKLDSFYLSDTIDLTILRATWNAGDERLFFLHKEIFLLDERDLFYIDYFPGIKLIEANKEAGVINGALYISGSPLRSLSSPLSINKCRNDNDLLIPCSARGNQSFAYGHFISEVLPDLTLIRNLINFNFLYGLKVLTFPLAAWANQLLAIFQIDRTLIQELPVNDIVLNNTPLYTAYRARVRFYSDSLRLNQVQMMTSVNHHIFQEQHNLVSVTLLSRESVLGARPARWLDFFQIYSKLLDELGQVRVSMIDPATDGPLAFHNFYNEKSNNLFFSPPGSAIYNALFLSPSPVLVALESIPISAIWDGQISDLMPYGHRIAFISRHISNASLQWDSSFNLVQAPSLSCLSLIFRYLTSCSVACETDRFIFKYNNFYLSLPLPANRS